MLVIQKQNSYLRAVGPQELIDEADLVTEMKEIKHYYLQGVMARKGIEKTNHRNT